MDSLKKLSLENETDNNDSTYRGGIEGTPFTICKDVDTGYYGVMGNHRITEQYKTLEEAEKETKEITWGRILQVFYIMQQNPIKL